jgi:hypothetical protein
MTHSLRPTKTRPSYSTLPGHDDDLDDVAGPSNQTAIEEDSDDDGSDFAPEDAQFRGPHASTLQGDIAISSTDGGVSQAVLSKRSIKAKGRRKSNVDSAQAPLETALIPDTLSIGSCRRRGPKNRLFSDPLPKFKIPARIRKQPVLLLSHSLHVTCCGVGYVMDRF